MLRCKILKRIKSMINIRNKAVSLNNRFHGLVAIKLYKEALKTLLVHHEFV